MTLDSKISKIQNIADFITSNHGGYATADFDSGDSDERILLVFTDSTKSVCELVDLFNHTSTARGLDYRIQETIKGDTRRPNKKFFQVYE